MARAFSIIIGSALLLFSCETRPAGDRPAGEEIGKAAPPPTTGASSGQLEIPKTEIPKTEIPKTEIPKTGILKTGISRPDAPAVKPEALAGAAAKAERESLAQAVARTAEKDGGIEAIAGALDTSVTSEKFKEVIGNLQPAALQEIAGRLAEAIQGQSGAIESLRTRIANLGAGDILGDKGAELKKSLDEAAASLTALADKLRAVIEKLRAEGMDVSRFTKLLGGE